MKRIIQFGVWLSLLVLASGLSLPASAQRGARKRGQQPPNSGGTPHASSGNQGTPPVNDGKNGGSPNPNSGQTGNPNSSGVPNAGAGANGAGNQQFNGRAGIGLPPKFVERLRDLPPEQQERFMRNNERFRNMSPEQQAHIRQNLQHWNSLTPEQRNLLIVREGEFERMTPQERQFVRQQVQPTWRDMPPPQRRFMMQHLHQLYGMSEPEARAKLSDPAFLQGMSSEQQKMLPYLYRLRVGAAPELPTGPPES